MFGVENLDSRNKYNPNLQNIRESAERTYGEANVFFLMVENYLKSIENNVNLLSEKDIYDNSNAIASELAKCCELYLKSIFIFENRLSNNKTEDIWKELKSPIYKTDCNGNFVYLLEKNNEKILTYVKILDNGDKVLDKNGKNIYVDKNNNEYSEGQQGKKIKLNGHQLDRLIDSLSNDTRLLLETRMLLIPMSNTEMYDEISIIDELKQKGIIFGKRNMSQEEYISWIDQHKKTYEETRYAGQNKYDINLEFLYHLTKQIKAVAQYKIKPTKIQQFDIDINQNMNYEEMNFIYKILETLEKEVRKDICSLGDGELFNSYYISEDEFSRMPSDLQDIAQLMYGIISKELIDLVLSNKKMESKLSIVNTYTNRSVLKHMNTNSFYNLIKEFDNEEISYLMLLCKFIVNGNDIDFYKRRIKSDIILELDNIANSFRILNWSVNDAISYSVYLKKKFNCKLNNNVFLYYIDFMKFINHYYNMVDEEIMEIVKDKEKLF